MKERTIGEFMVPSSSYDAGRNRFARTLQRETASRDAKLREGKDTCNDYSRWWNHFRVVRMCMEYLHVYQHYFGDSALANVEIPNQCADDEHYESETFEETWHEYQIVLAQMCLVSNDKYF